MNPRTPVRPSARTRFVRAAVAALAAVALVAAPALAASAAAPTPATDLDNACLSLRVGGGTSNYVTRGSVGYGTSGSASAAAKIRFEATDLGRYRLIDQKGSHLYLSVVNTHPT